MPVIIILIILRRIGLIFMDIYKNAVWLRLFGEGWKKHSVISSKIGAFAAVHDSQTVMLDKNASELMGFRDEPDYKLFMERLGDMDEYNETGMSVRLYFIDTEDNITAGFITLSGSGDDYEKLNIFPMLSQMELIQQMTFSDRPSLLALVELQGIDKASYAHCYMFSALNAVTMLLPEDALIASHSKLQFWIYMPYFDGNAEDFVKELQDSVKTCVITDEFGSLISEEHNMTFSAGISVDSAPPSQRMHFAKFALFDAESEGGGRIVRFMNNKYGLQKNEYKNIEIFTNLINNNLFKYHFQPIVSAHTGEIIAYEALMRTDPSIGLNPLQILDFAKKYNRLYDIERATINNTLSFLSQNQNMFENRKLFINSIPSYFLSQEDYQSVRDNYGELLEKVVIEFTEQTEMSNEAFGKIRKLLDEDKIELAIDDYGTGYSNTSNLLKYNPDYVKIDRILISDIDSNKKMQQIVSGIIEFLHISGYKALAEGIETYEELRTVMEMGIDLLQGYYISKPKPVLLNEVSDAIKREVVALSLENYGNIKKIYYPSDGECVDMSAIAKDGYTDLFIDSSRVVLKGTEDQTVGISVSIKEEVSSEIVLHGVSLAAEQDESCITLGNGSSVRFICDGDNKLFHGGIRVPKSASLNISGSGNLSVFPDMADSFGIGNDSKSGFGNILIDMNGSLSITANGDSCIGIGGGRNEKGRLIEICGGEIKISCAGGNCIGIGSSDGNALVRISNAYIYLELSASTGIGIGSSKGSVGINADNFKLDGVFSGNTLCAVGALSGGSGEIKMKNGQINSSHKGRKIICLGSYGGNVDCTLNCVKVTLYSEGGTVSGIGDMTGAGNVELVDVDVYITFLTGNGFGLGSPDGELSSVRGIRDIKINK